MGLIGDRCCTCVALLKAPSGGTWCVPSTAQYNAEQGCGRRSLHVAVSVLIKKESASVSSYRYESAVCRHTSIRNKLALLPSVSLINPVDFYQRFCVSLHWLFLGNEHCSVTHIQSMFRSPTTTLITGLSWIQTERLIACYFWHSFTRAAVPLEKSWVAYTEKWSTGGGHIQPDTVLRDGAPPRLWLMRLWHHLINVCIHLRCDSSRLHSSHLARCCVGTCLHTSVHKIHGQRGIVIFNN